MPFEKSDGLGRKASFTAKHGMREIVCPECEETYTAIPVSITTC